MNSFAFDWIVRQKVGVHVGIYILSELPLPQLFVGAEAFLAHGCLRLCCHDAGFAPLWRDQLGAAWSELSPKYLWPAIPAESDRWRLRAAMDATIAHGYELNRPEYQRVVGSFSHKSFPDAQELCLTAFDELAQIGHDASRRQHDPYYDTTLVMASAQPIIDLPRAPAKRREPRDGEVHSEAADWP